MSTDLQRVIVHPETGEVLDLRDLSTEAVAEALFLLRDHASTVRKATTTLDAELRDRWGDQHGGKVWIVGDYELKRKNESVWDRDELDGVIEDLRARGVIADRDVAGLIRHKAEVSATVAQRLLDRLPKGPDRDAVDACRTWRARGVEIARSIDLLEGASK